MGYYFQVRRSSEGKWRESLTAPSVLDKGTRSILYEIAYLHLSAGSTQPSMEDIMTSDPHTPQSAKSLVGERYVHICIVTPTPKMCKGFYNDRLQVPVDAGTAVCIFHAESSACFGSPFPCPFTHIPVLT